MKVYNKSKLLTERAKKEHCPRCKGHGSIITDMGDVCFLCRGQGVLWMATSGSGWCRPIGTRHTASILY